ncbi:MAG TPA: two-component sensor histidine kinase, partial [Caulobacter sp.]|nr:two-component sensor histidine kinase [Caulobacter sp.]
MTSSDLILAATAGAVCLALCATLWAMSQRRRFEDHLARLKTRAKALETRLMDAQGAAEAFETAVVVLHDGGVDLVSGEDALAACAAILDVAADAQAVVVALTDADPSHAHKLKALFEQGEACAFE